MSAILIAVFVLFIASNSFRGYYQFRRYFNFLTFALPSFTKTRGDERKKGNGTGVANYVNRRKTKMRKSPVVFAVVWNSFKVLSPPLPLWPNVEWVDIKEIVVFSQTAQIHQLLIHQNDDDSADDGEDTLDDLIDSICEIYRFSLFFPQLIASFSSFIVFWFVSSANWDFRVDYISTFSIHSHFVFVPLEWNLMCETFFV